MTLRMRTPAAVHKNRRRRLSKIVSQSTEHHRNLPLVRQIVDQFSRLVHDHQRVNIYVTFGMPFWLLRHTDEGLQLREKLTDRSDLI